MKKKIIPLALSMMLLSNIGVPDHINLGKYTFKYNIANAQVSTKWQRYTANYPENPTLEQMKALSIEAPDNMLSKIDGFGNPRTPIQYTIDLKAFTQLGWDGNLYHRYYEEYGTKTDEFRKILHIEPVEKNLVAVYTYECYFVSGQFFASSNNEPMYIPVPESFYNEIVAFTSQENPTDSTNPPTSEKIKLRLAGSNRISTGAEIAKAAYSGKVDNVLLASGYNFPDALSASVLAKKLNAPILLVGDNASDSQETLKYIREHLNVNGKITIIGGVGAVSDSIVSSLRGFGFTNFERIGGTDRFSTNELINKKLGVQQGTDIVIAAGLNFPDALSMSSIAAMKGYPIILADTDKLSNESINFIKSINPGHIYVAGGTGAVSDQALSSIKNYNITRFAGLDRYDTSYKILNYFKGSFSKTATIASGNNFPDALTGSVLAANENAPVILVDNSLDSYRGYFTEKGVTKSIIFGGTGAVPTIIENQIP